MKISRSETLVSPPSIIMRKSGDPAFNWEDLIKAPTDRSLWKLVHLCTAPLNKKTGKDITRKLIYIPWDLFCVKCSQICQHIMKDISCSHLSDKVVNSLPSSNPSSTEKASSSLKWPLSAQKTVPLLKKSWRKLTNSCKLKSLLRQILI